MKLKLLLISGVLSLAMATPALADTTPSTTYKYDFTTGADIEYARHTPSDVIGRNELAENIRRDKDIQNMPPTYFYGNGVFVTPTSNPYIYTPPQDYTSVALPTDNLPRYDTLVTGVNSTVDGAGSYYYARQIEVRETEPIEYSDGSIGNLKISSVGISAKVYEGDSLKNLSNGLGHFSYTSAWDGNVGIAGHNGGSAGYFESLKDVEKGDKITYTTQYGTRTYKVSEIKRIADDDFSDLSDTTDNQITLITCVRNQSTKRLCVIGKEEKS